MNETTKTLYFVMAAVVMATAAVVVLDNAGQVIARQSTIIGGDD